MKAKIHHFRSFTPGHWLYSKCRTTVYRSPLVCHKPLTPFAIGPPRLTMPSIPMLVRSINHSTPVMTISIKPRDAFPRYAIFGINSNPTNPTDTNNPSHNTWHATPNLHNSALPVIIALFLPLSFIFVRKRMMTMVVIAVRFIRFIRFLTALLALFSSLLPFTLGAVYPKILRLQLLGGSQRWFFDSDRSSRFSWSICVI